MKIRVVTSSRSQASKVAQARARYDVVARKLDAIRQALWDAGGRTGPIDDARFWRAVTVADEAMQQLIHLEEDLLLLNNPRFAWKCKRMLVINFSLFAPAIQRRFGGRVGVRAGQAK